MLLGIKSTQNKQLKEEISSRRYLIHAIKLLNILIKLIKNTFYIDFIDCQVYEMQRWKEYKNIVLK